jgi:hypothetical protein
VLIHALTGEFKQTQQQITEISNNMDSARTRIMRNKGLQKLVISMDVVQ